MIEINELRIGNIVSDDHGNHLTVDDMNEAGINFIDSSLGVLCRYYEAHGITLTPEWLERLGFEGKFRNLPEGGYIEIGDEEATLMPIDGCTGGHTFSCPCKYVHQLQNLYFALTGQELQVTSSSVSPF